MTSRANSEARRRDLRLLRRTFSKDDQLLALGEGTLPLMAETVVVVCELKKKLYLCLIEANALEVHPLLRQLPLSHLPSVN
ncbi:hypothetical protein KCP69_11520 [Salmonella enterica subsp. enterica]|nr:hypothetical protein KCP69_11520 [Salmonella enterica subsp. enterica]